MIKLKRIELDVLRSLGDSRDYTDIARTARISPSSVRRVLERLREKFLIRGYFSFKGLGYRLILLRKEFDPALYSRPIPFILEKIPLVTGKGKKTTYYLAMEPEEKQGEVADILKIKEEDVSPVRRFAWRPDVSGRLTLEHGHLQVEVGSLDHFLERVVVPFSETSQKLKPDHLDLWIIAEIMRDPFVSLSREAVKRGIKQQTASYHYTQHVKPFHLFNSVTPRFYSLGIPGVLIEIKAKRDMPEQVAWALSTHPFVRETFSAPNEKVLALVYLQGGDLLDFYKLLETSSLVEDFRFNGLLIGEIKEYTPPFGDAFKDDPYDLKPMFQAIYTPSTPASWTIFDISEGTPPS